MDFPKTPTTTFVDTGYFLGLLLPHDTLFHQARQWANAIRGFLVTTEYVLVEVADALSSPLNRRLVAPYFESLRQTSLLTIVPASVALFEAGLRLHTARNDKAWSLTDCISFHVMQSQGISRALAFDHHFEQAGFEALLRREP